MFAFGTFILSARTHRLPSGVLGRDRNLKFNLMVSADCEPTSAYVRHNPYFPKGKAMTEVVTALCVFFSISIFLAHAIDAVRAR
jgi:hypothetical protein